MPCFIVTLTTAATTYRLSDLIKNADPAPDPSEVIQEQAREIYVSAHPDNLGKIFGGEDANVSLLRAGYVLTPSLPPRIYQLHNQFTTTKSKYFVADTNGQRMLVELYND